MSKVSAMVSSMLREQEEKYRDSLKDLKAELAREMLQQTLDLMSQQNAKLEGFVERLEKRMPQSEFEYVYR